MKKIYILLLMIAIVVFAGCSKNPDIHDNEPNESESCNEDIKSDIIISNETNTEQHNQSYNEMLLSSLNEYISLGNASEYVSELYERSENESIKYLFGEPTEFNLVEPFSTIEQGRQAFDNYASAKQKLLSEIQIFKWDIWDEYLGSNGYMRKYAYEDVYKEEIIREYTDLLYAHDDMIVVPLLDKDGNDDVFILHILLYKGKPIAEIVLKKPLTPIRIQLLVHGKI